MWPFGKKKKKHAESANDGQKTKKTRVDKIVMGAILGVAIGSVVSLSLSPKKKNQITEKEEKPLGKRLFGLFKNKKRKKKTAISENPRKIPTEFE